MDKEKILKQVIDVLESIDSELRLSKSDAEMIMEKVEGIKINKGEPFLRPNKICTRIGILINGLLIAKQSDENNTVNRIFYSSKNIIVTNFKSFKNQEASEESIVAIEDSHLFYLEHYDLQELYKELPAMNTIGRIIAEYSYIASLERSRILQTSTALQKIDFLYKQKPSLFHRVSRKDINSYLGVSKDQTSNYLKSIKENAK